jgi:hypothetical protein
MFIQQELVQNIMLNENKALTNTNEITLSFFNFPFFFYPS